MLPIKRILVPVDFSQCSKAALRSAVSLAAALEAEVDVVHVWDRPSFANDEVAIQDQEGRHRPLGALVRENAEQEMREFLRSALEPCPGQDALPAHRLLSGEPASTLLAEIEKGKHELVVIGTHGRTGLRHLLLGSVAEKLVRHSPVPVWIAPSRRHTAEG